MRDYGSFLLNLKPKRGEGRQVVAMATTLAEEKIERPREIREGGSAQNRKPSPASPDPIYQRGRERWGHAARRNRPCSDMSGREWRGESIEGSGTWRPRWSHPCSVTCGRGRKGGRERLGHAIGWRPGQNHHCSTTSGTEKDVRRESSEGGGRAAANGDLGGATLARLHVGEGEKEEERLGHAIGWKPGQNHHCSTTSGRERCEEREQ